MSWAAKRETTRVEDMAYCLMGLFDVNMPPIYGEGRKAFTRLQLEILKVSDDESIFAWADKYRPSSGLFPQGLLASSPAAFEDSGDVRWLQEGRFDNIRRDILNHSHKRPPYSMTNKGLCITLVFIPTANIFDTASFDSLRAPLDRAGLRNTFVAPLSCRRRGTRASLLGVILQMKNRHGKTYERAFCGNLLSLDVKDAFNHKTGGSRPVEAEVYLQQVEGANWWLERDIQGVTLFSIKTRSTAEHEFSILQRYLDNPSRSSWEEDSVDGPRLRASRSGFCAALMFSNPDSFESFVLIIGLNVEERKRHVGVNVLESVGNQPLEEVLEAFFKQEGKGWSLMRFDRISKPLKDGKSVSVSLKNGAEKGKQRYLVDVTIDQEGSLPWPNPDL